MQWGNAARWRLCQLSLLVVLVASTDAVGKAKKVNDVPDSQAFVEAHNLVRIKVQKPAGYTKEWAPLPPVAWSDEVALGAQAWAEQLRSNKCKLMHSDAPYGENLAAGKDLDIAQAVQLWASEGKKYSYSPVYDFDMFTGHYTQVVWRKTTHIGCARVSCGKNNVVVCRYSPAGNRVGSAPY